MSLTCYPCAITYERGLRRPPDFTGTREILFKIFRDIGLVNEPVHDILFTLDVMAIIQSIYSLAQVRCL